MAYQVVFFGSFQNFSVRVLDALLKADNYHLTAVVTTPPAPKGRHLHLVKNETQIYSESRNISCYPLKSLNNIPSEIAQNPPDFIVVAGFGKLIPQIWLDLPKLLPVNLHPSLLPHYAGRCPAEWAILKGEIETGVTLIKMAAKFDSGEILAQKIVKIEPDDTRLTLYTKLFDLGADLLLTTLPEIVSGQTQPRAQPPGNYFYARQITRQDGFTPWSEFQHQLKSHPSQLSTKFRALYGWPGVWTTNPDGKRIKLVELAPRILIQEESRPVKPWSPPAL